MAGVVEVPLRRTWEDECRLDEAQVTEVVDELFDFIEPYAALLRRREQREHVTDYVTGRFRHLVRRTIEPIAQAEQKNHEPLQKFIGAGKWSDEPIRNQMVADVARVLGRPNGVLVIDNSGFPKKGTESVGVQRQWCGRLGKEENCQVGQFLAYVGGGSYILIDGELYLPATWLTRRRRKQARIPQDSTFQTGWQIADMLIQRHGPALPHAWVTGDEEYGVPKAFRDGLHRRGERYILEVNTSTKVWISSPSGTTKGEARTVGQFAAAIPKERWRRFHVRDGEKDKIEVDAVRAWVVTPRDDKSEQRVERLVIVRTPDGDKQWQFLSNAPKDITLEEMVRAATCRHAVEEVIELAKGDVGLHEYEVRSYVGWHHHLTLTLLALWFGVRQHLAVKKRLPRSQSRNFEGPLDWPWNVVRAATRRSRRSSRVNSAATKPRDSRTGTDAVAAPPAAETSENLGTGITYTERADFPQ